MKALGQFLVYLAATVFLAALAAPWLFYCGQWIGNTTPGLRFLAETDFVRYFTRAFLIVAVLLLWPVARWIRIGSVKELGLERNPFRWRDLAAGVLIPLGALWIYGVVLLATGFYEMKDSLPWHRIPAAIGTAAAVALVEEAFFRGGLFGVLRRTAPVIISTIVLSALFAILHFLKPPEATIPPSEVNWLSGFHLIPQVFHQFEDPVLVAAGFTTLFLMSVILCHVTVATRSLWLAIGLHAGLVLGARSFNILAQREKTQLPWVGEDLRIGLLPVIVLLGMWALLFVFLRLGRGRRSRASA